MTTAPPPHTDAPAQKGRRHPAIQLYSGLFILLGISAIAALLLTIINDPIIREVTTWSPPEGDPNAPAPSLLLAFLSQFGIVLPALLLLTGVVFIRLGLRLRDGEVVTARWAGIALLWLPIGAAALALINLLGVSRTLADADVSASLPLFMPVILPLLAVAPLAFAWWWLNRNLLNVFHGQEPLKNTQVRLAWNLLIPSLTIFVLVAARPLEQTFIRSLTDKRFGSSDVPSFVGLDNYTNLLSIRVDTINCRLDDDTGECRTRDDGTIRWNLLDRALLEEGYRTAALVPLPSGEQALALSGLDDDFLDGLATTIVFSVVSVSLELVIGLFIAMVVNSNFAGRGLMRAVMLIPWAIPTVISARLWELMLKDTSAGIFNRVLLDLGAIDGPIAWLSDPNLQLPAAIAVDVWKTSPFMALLLLAGLQTIPNDLYEAASVDGASRVRRFFSITLPLLRPTIAVALVFRMLDALRMFDLFNVLFGRQQLSVATYNYEVLVNNQQDGYASAVSMIIFVLIGIFAYLYVRILNVETD